MYVSYFIRHTLVRAAARSKDPEAPRARRWAHTEELLDRRAVEVSGCHGTQGAEDFVKSMKPGWLGAGMGWGVGGGSCSTTC